MTARMPRRRWPGPLLFVIGLAVSVAALWLVRSGPRPPVDITDGEGNRDLVERQAHAWPQWLGPGRDGVSPETGLLASWPEDGPPLRWETVLGPGYSSCAIAQGRLVTLTYADGHEVVVCLNADTGRTIWRRSYPCSYAGMDQRFNHGPRSTPAIDGDRVYTVGATGILACWQVRDGAKLWQRDLAADFDAGTLTWGVSFSPLIAADTLYVQPGGKKGSFAALDKQTGRTLWAVGVEPASYSSPVLCRVAGVDQLLMFTARRLVSHSPNDGRELWALPWETAYDLNVPTPILLEGDIFVSSGYGSGCARLQVKADAMGKLSVHALYRSKRLSNQFTNSVFHRGYLYGSDLADGHLVCLDYATGKEKWKEMRLGRASLLVADGKLIVLFEEGKLALVQPTPTGYAEVSSFAFSRRDECWTPPVLANAKLYVRDARRLACFDLRRR